MKDEIKMLFTEFAPEYVDKTYDLNQPGDGLQHLKTRGEQLFLFNRIENALMASLFNEMLYKLKDALEWNIVLATRLNFDIKKQPEYLAGKQAVQKAQRIKDALNKTTEGADA